MMLKTQVVRMVVAVVLMAPWGSPIQAASLQDRDRYCTDVLLQTEAQERNCAGAPSKYLWPSVSRSSIHLLCCLGSLSAIEVSHNYTSYLDKSMFLYIGKDIESAAQEKEVAKFVKQCSPLQAGNQLLNDFDFVNWLLSPSESRCTVEF